ncbi:hypothetical protein COW53_03415 [bacterium CG17_big_fil_post_rev_8_21_14_2_50_64_8]|nr:MAG: hypothetical protein COW53_03415 [bacterium CG17_big_fil_post_rev_8_21_14_2_50_64_8]
MLKCHEVSRLAASEEIARAGLWRRMEFRLHLMMCRHCRNYVRQVGLIGAAARRLMGTAAEDAQAVERLEAEIMEAVRKSDDSDSGAHRYPH